MDRRWNADDKKQKTPITARQRSRGFPLQFGVSMFSTYQSFKLPPPTGGGGYVCKANRRR